MIKENALELLETADNDPLLAFWPVGLGRAAVFTSDVKDRWAADWLQWRGYGPFFSSVVRALERRRPRPLALDVAAGPIHSGVRNVEISVEARDALGHMRNLLHPAIRATSGTNAPVSLIARQVAPGRYETRVVVDASKLLSVEVVGNAGESMTRMLVPDPAAEYRFQPADRPLLQSIASATGGTWQPGADAISNRNGASRLSRRPLWPALTAFALVLWFLDLLLRRIRVFEPAVNPEFASRPRPA